MKKKRSKISQGRKNHRSKLILAMKLTFFATALFMFCAFTSANSQSVNVMFENASLREVFKELRRQTGRIFVFNEEMIDHQTKVNHNAKDQQLEETLSEIFKETPYNFEIINEMIVVKPGKEELNTPQQQGVLVKGQVKDENGITMPGVTVIIKGTTVGVITNDEGRFQINVPANEEVTLIFSFIGMATKEVRYTGQSEVNITMQSETSEVDEVVVTGYFDRTKSSFTGAVTSVKREELRKFGNVNLIAALNLIDPSFKIKENNEAGANPNVLPDFFVRGEGSFMGSNVPTFIVDGYEVSLQYIFDMDLDRIESLNILKDASATVFYGSRAANGVVVIETRRPQSGKFTINYSNTTSLSFADLRDYDLLNAKEKLEYEIKAGLFTSSDNVYQHTLNKELEYFKANIEKGTDTDWLAQPVQNAVSHRHSLHLDGGTENVVYGITGDYSKNVGVIKKSSRENYGLTFDFTYRIKDQVSIRNSFSYHQTNVKNSPYGSFSDYAKANPYNPIYDEDGKFVKTYQTHSRGGSSTATQYNNPLYNASLPYKDEQGVISIVNNLSVDYRVTPKFRVKGSLALTSSRTSSEKYLSPNHTNFNRITELSQKGSFTIINSKSFSYDANLQLSYALNPDLHSIYAGLAFNVQENISSSNGYTATGFLDDRFNDINFALGYVKEGKPTGSHSKDRLIGAMAFLNYIYDNRYFTDFSLRFDGSSKYGKDKRFAPAWSIGAGWNINSESFMQEIGWMERLTIRASIGKTGNQSFDPNMAKTMLAYSNSLIYYETIGAFFKSYGNDKLEWQQSLKSNIGIDFEVLKRRLTARFDIYKETTEGLLIPVTVAPSLGFSSYTENYGEQSNRGIEFNINAVVLRKKDLDIAINFSGTRNKNKIEKISSALEALNRDNNVPGSSGDTLKLKRPIAMYEEGESVNAIKVVQSLGINPANGNELFLTRNGEITEIWDYQDKVVVGTTEPKLEGNIGINLMWKQFTFNAQMRYSYGGKLYNSTLSERVEGANPRANADKRVLEERWQKPGDMTFYKNIAQERVSDATSRFVQKNNYLSMSNISLSYRVKPELLRKWGIEGLRVGINTSDLFYLSTIKRERGTDYPFAQQYTFTLNLNF